MNLERVEQIARAVLYEGYMLYPYRPSSVKNQQRWNFGVLYPRTYAEAQRGADAWSMLTECLIEVAPDADPEAALKCALEVRVKFLQMVAREAEPPTAGSIESGPGTTQAWQEAMEREVSMPLCSLEDACSQPVRMPFNFPAEREYGEAHAAMGAVGARAMRRREAVCGEIELTAQRLGGALFRASVRVCNATVLDGASAMPREEVLLRSLVSTHTVLGVRGGEFVSLLDPPEALGAEAAECRNMGTYPVLVGEEGQRDTMLSSPIILYDYPQIAPESPGDLFDGTEIDEILSLRIMTLTEEEKREIRQSDPWARRILERTDALPAEQLMKLHGALRGLRPQAEEAK